MLQTKTVTPDTLGLLKKLMKLKQLNDFVLVGGTNLSLIYGHRKSIDLDLFTNKGIDIGFLKNFLIDTFSDIKISSFNDNMIFCYINGIKCDFVNYEYKLIDDIIEKENIRLMGIKDVIALKLNAIANRGTKKDFWDIAELINYYKVSEMIDIFKKKFDKIEVFHIIRSLVYFEDAESQPDPISLKKIDWKGVKNIITKNVNDYINNNK